MAQSIKLYLLLVLLPQIAYLLTKSNYSLAAVCESCSPSTYIDMYLSLLRNPASISKIRSFNLKESSPDTAQSQCTAGGNPTTTTVEHAEDEKDGGSDFGRVWNSPESVGKFQDPTVPSSLCFCSSSRFNTSSGSEQGSPNDNTEGGGWYEN